MYVRACLCVFVCGMCVFFCCLCNNSGRGGDQRVDMNGKHFLPCLPTLDLTDIIKTILLFLKYIHIHTFGCVYTFIIQMKNMQWRTSPGLFLCVCNLSKHSSAGKWSWTYFVFHWLLSMNTHPWVQLALPVTGLCIDSCTLSGSKSPSSLLNS